jgi:hypothetical protein
MNDLNVRRWTGAFGVAGFVVFLVTLQLYFLVPQPDGCSMSFGQPCL